MNPVLAGEALEPGPTPAPPRPRLLIRTRPRTQDPLALVFLYSNRVISSIEVPGAGKSHLRYESQAVAFFLFFGFLALNLRLTRRFSEMHYRSLSEPLDHQLWKLNFANSPDGLVLNFATSPAFDSLPSFLSARFSTLSRGAFCSPAKN